MKLSLGWVREWVKLRGDGARLAERLTMAGSEAECEPLAPALPATVVVGEILALAPHPQADRLRVCDVDAGSGVPLKIVCGAANARAGMKAPLALPGTKLPNGTEIRQAAVRGVESAGMLCSAWELGLAEKSDGLLELDAAARAGTPLAKHLRLADEVITLELTPNRGDCLSVRGVARELAAIEGAAFKPPRRKPVKLTGTARRAVKIDRRTDCSGYAGRAITGLDPSARSPDWLRERLRRSGLRCIHPLVDITHYVMLELGQPMHAFDGAKLSGGIRVRRAAAGERLKLLDQSEVTLGGDDLVIADDARAVALAGVMGGDATAVGEGTTEVFLESACFNPALVAATGRRHRLASDALYRFERGVDPSLQREALERASALVLEICGGQAGPVTFAGAVPKPVSVALRRERLQRLLGHPVADAEVQKLLTRLGLRVKRAGAGWRATIPPHRYDLRIEPDLIEEVARLHGYDRIPARPYAAQIAPAPVPEAVRPVAALADRLVARGWQEVVTYSFVAPAPQRALQPAVTPVPLDNPMAETMGVMRTSLWPGLIDAWKYNRQRQQARARLFEAGASFSLVGGAVVERQRLAGLAAGSAAPEQWGQPPRPVDFHDVKADLAALLPGVAIEAVAGGHPALHPGRSARLIREGRELGWLGALHPGLLPVLDLPEAPILFELDLDALQPLALPKPGRPPEFPSSRRDLALVVGEGVPVAALLAAARAEGGPTLRQAFVFDTYRGANLPNGSKSIALGLIFQDNSRTLTEQEVEASVQAVASRLGSELGASVRT